MKKDKKTSQYKGVHFCSRKKRWIGTLTKDKKSTYLGAYLFEEDAHSAYVKAKNTFK